MEKELHILVVDDEAIVHETLGDYLVQCGHAVRCAREGQEALACLEREYFDLVLLDILMPRMGGLELLSRIQRLYPEISVVMISGHGTMETAIQALRLGAVDFLTKPIRLLELDAVLEKSTRVRRLSMERNRLKETICHLQGNHPSTRSAPQVLGTSRQTEVVREQILLSARAGCDTVLVCGETGTGKEVVARQIHFQSDVREQPFIAVSCPALPDTLVESELFGHVRGAFTGAAGDRIGCFELANGGTLFLDEVADLSAGAQAKLLRVLETRMVRRIGGNREIAVDVRVVAATNTQLETLVERGRFRQDLLYRMNAFAIYLAPLRDRREDILPLARQFLADFAGARGMHFEGISPQAEEHLTSLELPGNARELRNMVERASILSGGGWLLPEHFLPPFAGTPAPPRSPRRTTPAAAAGERERILASLQAARWNRRQAAKTLGMAYSTLRSKIAKYRLE